MPILLNYEYNNIKGSVGIHSEQAYMITKEQGR